MKLKRQFIDSHKFIFEYIQTSKRTCEKERKRLESLRAVFFLNFLKKLLIFKDQLTKSLISHKQKIEEEINHFLTVFYDEH